jgi:hypothetical protein
VKVCEGSQGSSDLANPGQLACQAYFLKTSEANAIPNNPKRNIHNHDFLGYDSGA